MDISCIIPAYNQKKELQYSCDMLDRLFKGLNLEYEIFVGDDGSRDGTLDIFKEDFSRRPRVKVFSHESHQGFGVMFKELLKNAQGRSILYVDPSLPFSLDGISSFLLKINDDDIVVASRFIRNNPQLGFLLKLYQWLCQFFLKIPVKDVTSGMVIFRKKCFEMISLSAKGFDILPEIYAKAVRKNLSIKETPVQSRLKEDAVYQEKISLFTCIKILEI